MSLAWRVWLFWVVSFAAALPALAVEATLVGDAHVNSALPGANSGAISNLNVGGGYTALLQFDLSTLPSGTTAGQVSRAILRLYCNRVDVAGQVSVQAVSQAWNESTVTYATLPSVGGAVQVVGVSQAGAYLAVDVTALVQGWVGGSTTNNGVALTSGTAVVQFDSKENDLTGHAAMLDVELVSGGATGPAGPIGPAGPAGSTGAAGPVGPAGPAGAPGTPGLVYRGAYSPATTYGVGDVVLWQGSSYTSLLGSNLGHEPDLDSALWGVLSSQGPAGAQGLQGASGLQGPVGQSGAPGPQGTQGPAGATGSQGSAGPAGPAGPQGVPGAVGIRFRGAWVTGEAYQANDAVSFGGTTYLAIAGSSSSEPDLFPAAWAVLAQAGAMGPTGPTGGAASVSVGTVTTGAAGTQAAVVNSGTASAVVLNFTIPQGAAGASGSGGGTTGGGGAAFTSVYHDVSFNDVFYSVSSTSESVTETSSVLTWIPAGCTATKLSVFSLQANTITVTLRQGTPGHMADTTISCAVASASACSVTGSVVVPEGNFVDLSLSGASGTVVGVWMALTCN